jgi:hypothetical protein
MPSIAGLQGLISVLRQEISLNTIPWERSSTEIKFLLFLMASVTDLLWIYVRRVFYVPAQSNLVDYLGIIVVQKEVFFLEHAGELRIIILEEKG